MQRVAVLVLALACIAGTVVRAAEADNEGVPAPTNADGTSVAPVSTPSSSTESGSTGVVPTTPPSGSSTPSTPSAPSTPSPKPKKHRLRHIKHLHKRFPIEAEYEDEHRRNGGHHHHHHRRHHRGFVTPEYGDPHPRATEERLRRERRERRAGHRPHKRVFKTSFFSGGNSRNPHVKCFGRGHRAKCYRVDRKTGRVIGRDALHRRLPHVVAHTLPMHKIMNRGSARGVEYDPKLAMWKPRKYKRTLAPAPVLSLAEVDAEAADQEEAEAADEEEAEAEEEVAEEEEAETEEAAEDAEEADEEVEAEDEEEEADEAEEEEEAEEEF